MTILRQDVRNYPMEAARFHDLLGIDGNRNEKTPAKPGFRASHQ
jgi:hypothetical protein